MKIFICIKQVPDPNTTISTLDPTTKRLIRSGVSLVLDPGDESTIAAAIKLRDTLGKFRDEELQHRDIALRHGAEEAPGYRLLSAVIKAGCQVAIRISERI